MSMFREELKRAVVRGLIKIGLTFGALVIFVGGAFALLLLA